MSAVTIYTDSQGREITVGDGLLSAGTRTGTAFSIPLDADEMAALGTALIERATEAKHGWVSEQAGAAIGAALLDELLALRGSSQAEALRAVHDALHALSKLEHADSAAGGFAVAIVNVLEVGIANMPKLERGAK
ncbi:MAG: hypothetical protein RBT42_08185 [Aquabacterium sp.]|jgi:hypothetical protein|uniref:hypothetical protein n=1 Tax=Aquabacterium sp. TaxID=1872578 RepID=UPI002A36EFAE|nr:hypothetical protein [Aquabacterium sp.]MDX9843722.1 hypothetical protein [Aquabacterium sp.]